MEQNIPEWLNEFVNANFGQNQVVDQNSLVRDLNRDKSVQNQNDFNNYSRDTRDKEEAANIVGVNDQTGDKFEIVVQMEKNKSDKGLQIEFSSGNFKDNYICSSIEEFCNGKYAHLKNQPLKSVAEEIAKDVNYINSYIETSIACNSDSITIETAFDVTLKIKKDSSLSNSDYKKISSKLNCEDLDIYNSYLKKSNIRVLEPISSVKYYIDYIKNFKEYKMAENDISCVKELKNRIASIEKFRIISKELSEEFKKDSDFCKGIAWKNSTVMGANKVVRNMVIGCVIGIVTERILFK